MQTRLAVPGDVPAIIELLKVSLGESLMPKSERYWTWKHVENPFGPSPVLLAFEEDVLVGVRAFMRWQWEQGGTIFKAVRAVDTATHPAHQGKGIFKKLTLSLLDVCQQEGVNFVFNTPNGSSKPGYLKMGWEEVGRLPVRMSMHRPFHMVRLLISPGATSPSAPVSDVGPWLDHPGLEDLLTAYRKERAALGTNYSRTYLKWRYQSVPVAHYKVFGSEQGGQLSGVLAGRIKHTRLGKEFRVTDILTRKGVQDDLAGQLRSYLRSERIDYCAVSSQVPSSVKGIFFLPKLTMGPIVTCRPVNFAGMEQLRNFRSWSPSLGDLELF